MDVPEPPPPLPTPNVLGVPVGSATGFAADTVLPLTERRPEPALIEYAILWRELRAKPDATFVSTFVDALIFVVQVRFTPAVPSKQ